MKKVLLALSFVMVFGISALFAQTRTITGTVTGSDDGMPIPGASVFVEGTTIGTVTQVDGSYSLNVPQDAEVLVFSFVGKQTLRENIAGRSVINVFLVAEAVTMDEIVVVGYGTQSLRRVTTSIANVSAQDIENVPVANVAQALAGRMAGVQVSSTSGRPGSPVMMAVRGRSSIAAGNEPLIVIDGVPISNTQDLYNTSIGQGFSPLANLNPDDIASIDVLKDAAAAAIYGSRGSNGVVLITTKRGRLNEKSSITFNSYYGVQSIINERKLLGASEYREMYNESRSSIGEEPLFTNEQVVNPPHDVNWIDEIKRSSSVIQNYQIGASGGTERSQYYFGLGYFDQEGLLHNQRFQRYSIRLNLEHQINEFIKVGSNMSLSRTERNETSVDNSIYSPWPRALVARPDQAVFNEDGSYADNAYNNPVRMFEPFMGLNLSNVLTSNFLELRLIDGLTFRSTAGIDYLVTEEDTFYPLRSFQGEGVNRSGTSGVSRRMNYVLTQNLNYREAFLEDRLFLDAIAVFEFQKNQRDRIYTSVQDFPSDETTTLNAGASVVAGWTSWTGNTLESLLGRVNLSWEDRYLFGFSLRRDGSSRFSSNGRYGYFPSVSAGWNISEENFFSGINEISTLKLRASYGQTGNQGGIADFGYLQTFGAGENYNDESGLALARLGNPDLKWETTEQFDIGLEIGFFRNRAFLEFDYYKKSTKDLLISRPIPATTGFASRLENIGNMEGKGVDISVKTVNMRGDFNWNTTLTYSTYSNEITKLFDDQPISGSFVTRHEVGQPLGAFFVVKALGVDPETGDMIYDDIDGNGIINADDRQFMGSPMPKFHGGLLNEFSYRGFDLSIFFQGAYGHKLYKLHEEGIGGGGSLGAAAVPTNVFKDIYDDRWTTPGQNAKQPRVVGGASGIFNTQRSSRYLEDASFLRLKTITLGYTIPTVYTQMVNLNSVRFYVTGQNLLTFTNYTGFDPEISTETAVANYGVDQGAIPQMRTIMFGVSANF
ncbi:SusC/RagA family TonB-linked outer membrane protein [Alkalitalea saponilacus]|uniref:TonB-linked outer membrane protein, SusC/RagA family n=1 Tax=Alkalitalea saponilacus TaxID=889453 RepID=A0A1T5HRZ2_9BACT|nr:TonB-dependent receptor [Alkalitalea saponilacus]ASB50024.1 SusC/RagA family TonB-linked outer membrane protein [Alkalitalea saponilacus]SKC23463.1 TonB-linked outer membrane protein, SusC/RagA family [Alkalitalea saponilacus]